MYVDHERRMIYLAHPRTASTATAALLQTKGFEPSHGHHSRMWTPGCPITRGEWADYTVFTTIRNHWDTVVSWLHSTLGTHLKEMPLIGVDDLETLNPQYVHAHELWWMHTADADVVLRYETLNEDLSRVLGMKVEVPFKNVSSRRNDKHYSHFYTHYARKFVGVKFAKEIAECRYEFEEEL